LEALMGEWTFVIFIAVWAVLVLFVFPRLGIST
jgi:hypothetical protein